MPSANGGPRRERKIIVRGAREHNLKDLHLEIPRDKLIVVTGLSGSGKSSLAFDTLYAEGQRRYIESLSAYARQFMDQMDKPDVDSIEGLSPTIAIEQKTISKNPRSTVGTVTEIYDHLRLLYARLGTPHCPSCGRPMNALSVEQMVARAMGLGAGKRIEVLAPLVRGRKGIYRKELDDLQRKGFARARVDGRYRGLEEEIALDRHAKHNIEVVVDRVVLKAGAEKRLGESIETALSLAKGLVMFQEEGGSEYLFSRQSACAECGVTIPEMAPRMFSFNSPYGACPACGGLGSVHQMDPARVVPDPGLSLEEGALAPLRGSKGFLASAVRAAVEAYGIPAGRPFSELSKRHQDLLLHGNGGDPLRVRHKTGGRTLRRERAFPGVLAALAERREETQSDDLRAGLEQYMSALPCEACKGGRLRPESLGVTFGGKNISEVCAMTIQEARPFFARMSEVRANDLVAERILKEVNERLEFLDRVGLDYLTLDRPTGTLAGGEGQRIRLAGQIGASLVGVLYILDEPSIGLHQRDNRRLLGTLRRLRDNGNTVIVVEHDRETIESADYVVDLGPGAGEHGGRLVACGPPDAVRSNPDSLTGRYLAGELEVPRPAVRRKPSGRFLTIREAAQHNLRGIDVSIPLGLFVCVAGVSGSGKSTLVEEILYRALARRIYGALAPPGAHRAIEGAEHIDKVIDIDQSPIGRTPRSNPATYTGVFSPVRELFAQVPEARKRGYKGGRFSFNVKGGRCEACEGDGCIRVEMHFLPDLYAQCGECRGRRFNRDTLDVRYKGRNIAEVLEMTVDEAAGFFENINALRWKLRTLQDVGLGYVRLGQPATTLSGGEAQRIKLAKELSRQATGRTLYILDEPTTGLHFADIEKLLAVLHRLVDQGNTVVVIEHNLDVIKAADYVLDLGPEGGKAGGLLVAEGTPEEVAAVAGSHTGAHLRQALNGVLARHA
ncbi:MAG: excinuclease ABC subunit UvrA [Candidatus Tectomicrobia bacterium]|nr:excinuclease ABC subunit UvrA [Candidatus Tectomicrobia bacterium]